MRILILKPSSLGDVVQALPVLRLLRLRFPEARIDWWIAAELSGLLENDPDLTGLIPFVRRGWSRPAFWNRLTASLRTVRQCRYDWVIDLQSLARSALFSWASAGGLLIGLDDLREGASAFYDVRIPRPAASTHAVDWYLKVLEVLHVPVHWEFDWIPVRAEIASKVTSVAGPGRRIISVVPGARWANKRWPVEYYAAAVRLIQRQVPDAGFAILGGAADRAGGEQIAAAAGLSWNLAGQTSLPEMIEWIRASALVITNDTGPMHVAAALRRPVVGIFGPTEPRRTGPYGQQHQALRATLPCVPCMKDSCANPIAIECMWAVRPEAVAAEAVERLSHAMMEIGRASSGLRPTLAPTLCQPERL